MSVPKQMRSVWPEMPFMHGDKGAERLREWWGESSRVHRTTQNRRDRVLAYDWARVRLCRILVLRRAESWNGYVPPYLDCDGRINDARERRELIELLRDVAKADAEAAAALPENEIEGGADGADQIGQTGTPD